MLQERSQKDLKNNAKKKYIRTLYSFHLTRATKLYFLKTHRLQNVASETDRSWPRFSSFHA